MFKLIIFVLGLAIGACGGVWWAVKNPDKAMGFQKQQEEWVLTGKLEAMKKSRDALDGLIAKQKEENPTPAVASRIVPGSTSNEGKADAGTVKQRDALTAEIAATEAKLAELKK